VLIILITKTHLVNTLNIVDKNALIGHYQLFNYIKMSGPFQYYLIVHNCIIFETILASKKINIYIIARLMFHFSTGSVKAVINLPKLAAKGGTVLYAGMYPNSYEMPSNLYQYCYKNELTLTIVSPYTFPRAVQILPKMKLDKLITQSYPIDQAEETFAAQVSGKYLKVLIDCN
jgi:hypothetical protein